MNAVILFAKYPVSGQVKTRLGKSIGMDRACALYRGWLLKLVKELKNREFKLIVTGFSSNHLQEFKELLRVETLIPRSDDSLNAMLLHTAQTQLENYNKILLIGSDTPDIDNNLIQEASQKLDSIDIIIGPDNGGGMYLIGMKHAHDIFTSIRYSQGTDKQHTLELCKKLKLTTHLLKELIDIDTKEDLDQWQTLNSN